MVHLYSRRLGNICFAVTMDSIKVVMKDMLAGEKVRIGYLGLTPIFSLSQAINLAAGYSSSSSFGSTFINCTMKDKHPALYAAAWREAIGDGDDDD